MLSYFGVSPFRDDNGLSDVSSAAVSPFLGDRETAQRRRSRLTQPALN